VNDGKQLYEYAVLHRDPEGPTEVVLEPTHVLAKDEKVARMIAIREVPADKVEALEEMEVLVSPFAGGSRTANASLDSTVSSFVEGAGGKVTTVEFRYGGQTHRLLKANVSGGVGYCPIDLLQAGNWDLAATVAKAAFDNGV